MMNQGGMYMDPSSNNEPLMFNQNRGKPPMPVEGGRRSRRSEDGGDDVSSSMGERGGPVGIMGQDGMMMQAGGDPNFYASNMNENMANMGGNMGSMANMGGNMGNMAGNMAGMGGNMGNMDGNMTNMDGNMGYGPMMGPTQQDIMNQMMMYNQFGNWGQLGPMGPGPMMAPDMPVQKEIMTLKSCVLYPPPLNAPPPTTRERPAGCRTVFIGGLPENITEEILTEVFGNFGPMVSVRKSKKNFAHIRYETEDCVERALVLSGYRMKIEDKDDKPNTGRLHVDYAQARDDQYEFECKMRALEREMRHRQRMEEERLRPPSPPPVIQYSTYEGSNIIENLKNPETFSRACQVLQTWLERGDCNHRSATTFFSMLQCTNAHVRSLITEKDAKHQELEQAKIHFQQAMEGILRQFDQIERVFTAAQKQKNRDHFTKAQRKSVDQWLKQIQEMKNKQQNEFLNERKDDEMEMSDEEDAPPVSKKKKQQQEMTGASMTAHYVEMASKLGQLNNLREENDNLKCQMEAYKNEVDLVKQEKENAMEAKEKQMKSLQQALQGMQQQLIQSREEILNLKKDRDTVGLQLKNSTKEAKETDTPTPEVEVQANPVSSTTGLHISEKEAKLIGLVSCFLHVHPTGATSDYIWSYLHRLGVTTRVSEVESLLEKMSTLFTQTMSGVGATIERRWTYIGYNDMKP